VLTNEDHQHVGDPHGEREQDFGVCEECGADGLECDDGADEQASGHAGQAEEQRLEGDLVDGFERRKEAARSCGTLLLEAAFLKEIEQAGEKRDEEGGVGCEQKSDVEQQPSGADEGVGEGFVAGTEGGHDGEKHRDGQKEYAEGDGFVLRGEQEERCS